MIRHRICRSWLSIFASARVASCLGSFLFHSGNEPPHYKRLVCRLLSSAKLNFFLYVFFSPVSIHLTSCSPYNANTSAFPLCVALGGYQGVRGQSASPTLHRGPQAWQAFNKSLLTGISSWVPCDLVWAHLLQPHDQKQWDSEQTVSQLQRWGRTDPKSHASLRRGAGGAREAHIQASQRFSLFLIHHRASCSL